MKNAHHHDFKDKEGVDILCHFPDSIRSTIQFLMTLPDQTLFWEMSMLKMG